MIEEVQKILHGWDNLRIEDNGAYWLIAGGRHGQSHAGTRDDPISLAYDLVAIAAAPVSVQQPPRYAEGYNPSSILKANWDKIAPPPAAAVWDQRDDEINALRKRIAELEAAQQPPAPPVDDSAPPSEVMAEAMPDEDYTELKHRLLIELGSLRNMLVGNIPMTPDEQSRKLERLAALEHPTILNWLQG